MGFFERHLLSTILFTPVFGAMLLACVGGRETNRIRWIATLFGVLGFFMALPLWFGVLPFGAAWQSVERGPGIRSIGATYVVGVDGVSALLVLLATLVGAIAILASWTAAGERAKKHYIVMLLVQAGLVGALVSLDALLFFLFSELTLVPAVLLMGAAGGRRVHSTIRLLIPGAAGGAVLLAAILALYFFTHAATGVYTFDITEWHRLSIPGAAQRWMFVAFFLGFAMKVTILPLRLWRLDANDGASAGSALLIAAMALSLGTYGLIRFNLPILPEATRLFAPIAAALAAAVLVCAVLAAFVQTDWRRALACAAASQMALVALGILSLTPAGITGGLVQQISQAICTAALLLIAGIATERGGMFDIQRHARPAKAMPVFGAMFLVMALTSIGLPPLSGFVGSMLILQGLNVAHPALMAVAALGIGMGAAHLLSLYRRTMTGTNDDSVQGAWRDLNGRELTTLLPLVLLAVWIGVHPEPVLRRLQSSVGRIVVRVNPAYGPAIAQAEAECNAAAAPPPVPDAPAGLMVAPPCDTPATAPPPAARPDGR
jgi:NADH-quinone oxidoreductase subunit M